jgi:hypothetical protein
MEQQQQQQQQQNNIEVYPIKEEAERYKVACDIAYRRTNVLRLSAQYLSERDSR